MIKQILPHWNALLNATIVVLLVCAFVAIRRGNRTLHPKLMLSAVAVGCVFLASYILQVALVGHQRFPGNDWVRTAFLWILGTHTLLAVCVVPVLLRTLYLGFKQRFEQHRKLARWTFAIWLYVALTGVVIYLMNNHVRPPGSLV